MKNDKAQTCQVCFIKPHKSFDYARIIQCGQCKLTCHKSCYNPSFQGNKFTCDFCAQTEEISQNCFLCGNKGLLKKVQNKFAHPICLLFSQTIIVLEYNQLTFSILSQQQRSKKDKKYKCKICKNPGNLEKCFSNCQNRAHMYCVWKFYISSNSEGWIHNPIVDKYEYSSFYEKKQKQYISKFIPGLVDFIGLYKYNIKVPRQFQLTCPTHLQQMFECCTQYKYFQNENEYDPSKIDYIQCEQCFRWYHQGCLDKKVLPKNENTTFICPYCEQFFKIAKEGSNDQLFLKKFPRLNICELIYVQCLFQKRNYNLSQNERTFMFQMPIEPSLVFLENNLKKSIYKALKVSEFQVLCKLNLDQRMERKHLKDKFCKSMEMALSLVVGKKSLIELIKQYNEQLSKIKVQEQQIVENEQKRQLQSWIQLLQMFSSKFEGYDKVISRLIVNLQVWLSSLDIKMNESQSWQSNNEIVEQKNQRRMGSKIRIKKHQIYEQSSEDNTYNENVQQSQYIDKQQQNKQQQQNNQQQKYKKREQQQNGDLYRQRVIRDDKLRQVEQNQQEQYICIDKQKENYIFEIINKIKILINNNQNINLNKLLELFNQSNNKCFIIKYLFYNQYSAEIILRCIILQTLFQQFLKIIELSEQTQNLKNINNISNQQNQPNQSNHPNNSNQILLQNQQNYKLKLQGQQPNHKKIKFLILFSHQLRNLYYQSNQIVQQQFKQKLQFILNSLSNLCSKLKNQDKKIRYEQRFNEAFNIVNKDPNRWDSLKKRVRQSVDSRQLVMILIQGQRRQAYLKIKNVQFTRLQSNQMSRSYEIHCKSSSEYVNIRQKQSQTNQKCDQIQQQKKNNEQQIKDQKSYKREQILKDQKKVIILWINIFGLIYELSNELLLLLKTYKQKQKSNQPNKIIQQNQSQLISFIDQQPLQIIINVIKNDYIQSSAQFKIQIAKKLLLFFYKINLNHINPKIFHHSLSNTLEIVAKFCIQYSFQDVLFWAQHTQTFIAMKIVYQYFKSSFNHSSDSFTTQLFNRIWGNFQMDVIFQAFLQANKNLLFNDPDFTQMVYREKIPSMMAFYKKVGFICRVKKLSRIRLWIVCYLKSLQKIGFEILVDEQYHNSVIRDKQSKRKISFNQLAILFNELQRNKFPSCEYTNKLIMVYRSVQLIQNRLQQYYRRNNESIDRSYQLKNEFLTIKNIKKDYIMFDINQDSEKKINYYNKVKQLIKDIQNSQIITFDLQRQSILNDMKDFNQQIQKAQQILLNSNTNVPIQELNTIFFKILAFPFQYTNINVFHLFIRQRTQRQTIIEITTSNIKRKQIIENIQKQFNKILSSLEPSQKIKFPSKLTKDLILSKLQAIQNNQQYQEVNNNLNIKLMRDKISQKIYLFDQIKQYSQQIVMKVNSNRILENDEIETLNKIISQYKHQNVLDYSFQFLFGQLQIYKLSFNQMPNSLPQIQLILSQFINLRPSFKTKQIQSIINDLQKKMKNNQFN